MKIDFSAPILDPSGQPIQEDGKDTTLAVLASTALLSSLKGDETLTPAKKAEIGALGIKLFAGGEHDLSVEQVATIKERIGLAYSPLAVARAFALLDPVEPSVKAVA